MGFPERPLQLADALFQDGLPDGIGLERVLNVLFSPMIQKTGRNAMSPAELGCSADPAQIFFNNLTFELGTELPLLAHDKILSALEG